MIINHNMNAINTNRVYQENLDVLGKNTERLSSGMRINRAQDDAAGLAVSEKLRTQSRGLTQGSRNASDALDFIRTTEGHLKELTGVLQRMRVLSIQSANGTYSEEDRSAIQIEVDQLTDEIGRIADQADFNKMRALTSQRTAASDPQALTAWTLSTPVTDKPDEALVLNFVTPDFSNLFASQVEVPDPQPAAEPAPITVEPPAPLEVSSPEAAVRSTERIKIALQGIAEQQDGLTAFQVKLASLGDDAVVDIDEWEFWADWGTEDGTDAVDEAVEVPAIDTVAFLQDTESRLEEAGRILHQMRVLAVQSANFTPDDAQRLAIQAEVEQLAADLDRVAAQEEADAPASLRDQASWTLRVHVGANTNEALAVNIFAANVTHLFAGEATAPAAQDDTQPLAGGAVSRPVNVMTAIDANSSIAKIDVAIKSVTDQRSNLGAFSNGLESAFRSADYAVENLTASDSTIRDAYMADVMVEFTKNNILTQASQAMLAQANQLPQGVLQLLR
ncbi:flagellin [Streptomyces sp. NPDC059564]|uniref:flagellin N-terminal helical domain-containing protein n=1 Tax=Streptomyces sp. NPDC059564 TaxID=3346865 RepID=UPI0036A052C2